jgi:Tol biopolymer transport system component
MNVWRRQSNGLILVNPGLGVCRMSIALVVRCRYAFLLLPALWMRGGVPVEFAPGIISTGNELPVTFSPDGHEVYFTRATTNPRGTHIMRSTLGATGWQPAERVPFSSDAWADLDPAVSPDGKRLYFVSTRPRPDTPALAKPDMDIWFVEREGDSWSAPHWIEALSSDAKEGSPTVDRSGTLCFFSDRNAAANRNSIYCAAPAGQSWSPPVKLNADVNAGPSDTSPFLSPDGNILLFYSERAGGFGKADLYVSTKRDGQWQAALNLGSVVNTSDYEYNPSVSRDGKTLYFGRARRVWSLPIVDFDQHVLRAEMFR